MPSRIVSLAPSATSTIRELGLADRLVGRTAHTSGPEPAVGGWLTPDIDAIAQFEPDLVVAVDDLQEPIVETLEDAGYDTVHYTPQTLDGVWETIEAIGCDLHVSDAGRALATSLRERVASVRARVTDRPRPIVYCEEWQEPPMVAGNWVPEMIEAAGGRYPFLDPGERSREADRAMIESEAPDFVVLHPCGVGTAVDVDVVTERGWPSLSRQGVTVTVIDDSLINQPGPSLAAGIERLADILHPLAGSDPRGTSY